jgi:hypothetical protein
MKIMVLVTLRLLEGEKAEIDQLQVMDMLQGIPRVPVGTYIA